MEYFIASAREELSASVLGILYEKAVAYLAAHRYTIVDQIRSTGGSSGRVTQKTEGRLSISFGGVSSDGDDYSLTNYGLQLKSLIHKSGAIASSSSEFAVNYLMR
jgi:hypothetical protein